MTFWYILLAVLMFGFMVLAHELGHFAMARVFHVSIREFSVGMGPKIASRVSPKSGTRYSLRLLPIGGFVSMVGEDEESEEVGALNRKPVWQRMLIIAAGAVVNILCAVVVMSILVLTANRLGSTVIRSFDTQRPVYSADSGLQVDDQVLKVGKTAVHTSAELCYEIMQQGATSRNICELDTDGDGKTDAVTVEISSLTVNRGGEKIVLHNVTFPGYVNSGHVFGDYDFYVYAEEKNFVNTVKHAVFESWNSFQVIWDSMIGLLGRRYSIADMSGPVGVTGAITTAAKNGMGSLLYIFVLISMNLGVFNLLPIPALDGGRFLFLLLELIRGKPVKPQVEGYIHFVGICLLMLLMLIVTFQDVSRLL